MKYSIALLSAVGAVVAQDLGSLPACGQTCIQNMIGIASSQFGCTAGDISCYCSKIDFGYGVRDCSTQACGSAEEANQVIAYGTNYCAQAIASAGASSIEASGLSILSSAAAGATGGATGTEGGSESTPVTTRPLETTVVSDGITSVETTGFITEYAPVGGAASSVASEATEALSSVLSEITGALSTAASDASEAVGSATSTDSSEESSAAASDAASSTNAEGAAPIMTAAPVLGGAALAALLLI